MAAFLVRALNLGAPPPTTTTTSTSTTAPSTSTTASTTTTTAPTTTTTQATTTTTEATTTTTEATTTTTEATTTTTEATTTTTEATTTTEESTTTTEAAAQPGVVSLSALFTDTVGHLFEAEIDLLAEARITLGCNPPANDRFCPDDPVTRDQMASFLARALGLDPIIPPPRPTTTTTVATTTTTSEPTTTTGGSACDAAYPTVCIPFPPPDLNCPVVPYVNFKVLPPDPHNFDGNSDGVGCESD